MALQLDQFDLLLNSWYLVASAILTYQSMNPMQKPSLGVQNTVSDKGA